MAVTVFINKCMVYLNIGLACEPKMAALERALEEE
jgi:hypothetical protein